MFFRSKKRLANQVKELRHGWGILKVIHIDQLHPKPFLILYRPVYYFLFDAGFCVVTILIFWGFL